MLGSAHRIYTMASIRLRYWAAGLTAVRLISGIVKQLLLREFHCLGRLVRSQPITSLQRACTPSRACAERLSASDGRTCCSTGLSTAQKSSTHRCDTVMRTGSGYGCSAVRHHLTWCGNYVRRCWCVVPARSTAVSCAASSCHKSIHGPTDGCMAHMTYWHKLGRTVMSTMRK